MDVVLGHTERMGMRYRGSIEDDFEHEWARWQEQKQLRLLRGDDLTADRDVVHTSSFRRRRHAERAIGILRNTRGGRLSRLSTRPRWMVEAIVAEPLTDAAVEHSLRFMMTVTRACGGTYEGFGAIVVSGEE